jgi:WD40 repeat protein
MTLKLWDAKTGSLYRTLSGHAEQVEAVAFSSAGNLLVSGSNDGTINVWDWSTGVLCSSFNHDLGHISAAAVSCSGQLTACMSLGKAVMVWSADEKDLIRRKQLSKDTTRRLSFSRDGSCLKTDRGRLELRNSLTANGDWETDSSFLYIERQWITLGTQRLLWLPSDYRATCWAVFENTIVVGHASGRVSLIKLNLDGIGSQL